MTTHMLVISVELEYTGDKLNDDEALKIAEHIAYGDLQGWFRALNSNGRKGDRIDHWVTAHDPDESGEET